MRELLIQILELRPVFSLAVRLDVLVDGADSRFGGSCEVFGASAPFGVLLHEVDTLFERKRCALFFARKN